MRLAATALAALIFLGVADARAQTVEVELRIHDVTAVTQPSSANRVAHDSTQLIGEDAAIARTYIIGLYQGDALYAVHGDIVIAFSATGQVANLETSGVHTSGAANQLSGMSIFSTNPRYFGVAHLGDDNTDSETVAWTFTIDSSTVPSGVSISPASLTFNLQSVDYDSATATTSFVPGDTGAFSLEVSQLSGGTVPTHPRSGTRLDFTLSADLLVSHGCKGPHCAINLMAVEISWPKGMFILDTEADNVLAPDSVISSGSLTARERGVYYEAMGARSDDAASNAQQPDTDGRIVLLQDPSESDYDSLFLEYGEEEATLTLFLLDSFEDTDMEIRCDAEDETSPRHCSNFQLLQFSLLVIGQNDGHGGTVRPADTGRVTARLKNLTSSESERLQTLASVHPEGPYSEASVEFTYGGSHGDGDNNVYLLPAMDLMPLSTMERADGTGMRAPKQVATLMLEDGGEDGLPLELAYLQVDIESVDESPNVAADLRFQLSGPGLAGLVENMALRTSQTQTQPQTQHVRFGPFDAGTLRVENGRMSSWTLTVWLEGDKAGTYEDGASFNMKLVQVAAEIAPRAGLREREVDASGGLGREIYGEENFSSGAIGGIGTVVSDPVALSVEVTATQIQTRGAANLDFLIPPSGSRIRRFPTITLLAADADGNVDTDFDAAWSVTLQDETYAQIEIFPARTASAVFTAGMHRLNTNAPLIDVHPEFEADNKTLVVVFSSEELTSVSVSITIGVLATTLLPLSSELSGAPGDDLSLSVSLAAVGLTDLDAPLAGCHEREPPGYKCVKDIDGLPSDMGFDVSVSAGTLTLSVGSVDPVTFVNGAFALTVDLSGAELPMADTTLTVTLAPTGGGFILGVPDDVVLTFQAMFGSRIPFVLDFNDDGIVDLTDGVVMGRVILGIDGYISIFGYDLNSPFAIAGQTFKESLGDDGTLDPADAGNADFLRQLTNGINTIIFTETGRFQAGAWVVQMIEHATYPDDLDLNDDGVTDLTDGVVMGRVILAIDGYISIFGYDLNSPFAIAGQTFKESLEDDGTLDPADADNADFLRELTDGIDTIIFTETGRFQIGVKVLALLTRVGALPPE